MSKQSKIRHLRHTVHATVGRTLIFLVAPGAAE